MADAVSPLYRILQAQATLDHTRGDTEATKVLAQTRQLALQNQIEMQQQMMRAFGAEGGFTNDTGPSSQQPAAQVGEVDDSPLGGIRREISALGQRANKLDQFARITSPFNPELGQRYAKEASDLKQYATGQQLEVLKEQSKLYDRVAGIAGSVELGNPASFNAAVNQINRFDPMLLRGAPLQRDQAGGIIPNEANTLLLHNLGKSSMKAKDQADVQHQMVVEGQNAQRIANEEVAAREREIDRDRDAVDRQTRSDEAREERKTRQSETDFQKQNTMAQKVSSDYRIATKDFVEQKGAFMPAYRYLFKEDKDGKIVPRESKEKDSSSDMALRDSYMKMVHPNYKGSVYEKKELEKLASLPRRFVSALYNLGAGNELPDNIRYDMFNAMKRQFNEDNAAQIKLEDAERAKLARVGMAPMEVETWVRPLAIRGSPEQAAAQDTKAAPAGPKYVEGQTATGPGGQKMIFTGGKWQPIQ